MSKTIEKKAVDAILQSPVDIKIGDEVYKVHPPTIATMILASKAIADLPEVNEKADDILSESLRVVKDCSVLGEIFAIFILGAKNLIEEKVVVEKRLFGLLKKERIVEIDRKSELTKKLLESLTPKELHKILVTIFTKLEIADFFGITVSLTKINLMTPKETVTTASGRSSHQS